MEKGWYHQKHSEIRVSTGMVQEVATKEGIFQAFKLEPLNLANSEPVFPVRSE